SCSQSFLPSLPLKQVNTPGVVRANTNSPLLTGLVTSGTFSSVLQATWVFVTSPWPSGRIARSFSDGLGPKTNPPANTGDGVTSPLMHSTRHNSSPLVTR